MTSPCNVSTRTGVTFAVKFWLTTLLVAIFMGCSRPQPAEIFKLRSECANQARSFESAWRRDNGSDFRFLFFSNHYNQRRGRCFVKIFYGHPDLNVETIYDATEGIGKPPVVTSIGGNDESANESKEHLTVAAEIRDYMEEASR
jgi:hypothetical protein